MFRSRLSALLEDSVWKHGLGSNTNQSRGIHVKILRRNMAMLRSQALFKVLTQANTGGIQSTLLLNPDGVLLAYAGYGEHEAKTTAALLSSVWSLHAQEGKGGLHEDKVRQVILEMKDGCVMIIPVARLLLCLCARSNMDTGLIRAKAHALVLHLEGPLLKISTT